MGVKETIVETTKIDAETNKNVKNRKQLKSWSQLRVEEECLFRQDNFVEQDADIDALNPERLSDFSKIGANSPDKSKDSHARTNQADESATDGDGQKEKAPSPTGSQQSKGSRDLKVKKKSS